MMHKIAEQIRTRIGDFHPQIALILGSGLGALADSIQDAVSINYTDINGFPRSTVPPPRGAPPAAAGRG